MTEAKAVVAKRWQALTKLSQRDYVPAARQLLEKLSQLVLISCPHPTVSTRESWPRLDHILRHDRGYSSKVLKAGAEEAGIAANLCSNFLEAGIRCPVLTTFACQPVTLRHGLKTEKRVVSVKSPLSSTPEADS